jgi:hypothetical protein
MPPGEAIGSIHPSPYRVNASLTLSPQCERELNVNGTCNSCCLLKNEHVCLRSVRQFYLLDDNLTSLVEHRTVGPDSPLDIV